MQARLLAVETQLVRFAKAGLVTFGERTVGEMFAKAGKDTFCENTLGQIGNGRLGHVR